MNLFAVSSFESYEIRSELIRRNPNPLDVSGNADVALSIFEGVLCLGSPQGRYGPITAANQGVPALDSLGQFDANGVLLNLAGTSGSGSGFDVPLVLPATVGTAIAPGDRWFFQAWYRDQVAGQPTANFSDAVEVAFS